MRIPQMPRVRVQYVHDAGSRNFMRLWIRWISLGVAVACLAWVGEEMLEQFLYQRAARESFEEARELKRMDTRPPARSKSTDKHAPRVGTTSVPPSRNSPLARLRIDRAEIDAFVQEGFDADTLSKAVGHAPSSARPGERGNVVLAAHRDTFFAGLRYVKEGDLIDLESAGGRLDRYRVSKIMVVKPTDSWVMKSTPDRSLLTLITCYPFRYVGSAPNRLVVQAQPVLPRKVPKKRTVL